MCAWFGKVAKCQQLFIFDLAIRLEDRKSEALVLSLCSARVRVFCPSSFFWVPQTLLAFVARSLPGRQLRLHTPDFTRPLGYIHLPGENLCSPQTSDNACVLVHMSCQGKNRVSDTQATPFLPGSHASLPMASLSPALQMFSLGSGAVSVTTLFGNYMDPTSVLIYPKSSKRHK